VRQAADRSDRNGWQRRAQTVREYLVSRGVSAQRMRTISYGKERPVALCNDISCWSQNRRVVTVLNQSS
jgi:peptidoglycan-associated lipoprotein